MGLLLGGSVLTLFEIFDLIIYHGIRKSLETHNRNLQRENTGTNGDARL